MTIKYAGENTLRCFKTKVVALINAAKSAAATAQSTADNAASAANGNTSAISTEATRAKNAEKDIISRLDADGAGAHNAIYRGKYLGASVTAAQYAAIADGSFTGLYIGDYWTIGGVNYRVAAFDYYYGTGDTACATHHAVIVPDDTMGTVRMTSGIEPSGGYAVSEMRKTTLTTIRDTIKSAFGSAHILSHRQYLCNAITSGLPTGYDWYDSSVELMTVQNIYGNRFCGADEQTIDGLIFPLFAFSRCTNGGARWMRNTVDGTNYVRLNNSGYAEPFAATRTSGIRPSFCICK